MSSSNIQYDPLPRSSRDLEGEEFKDKPLPRRPPRFPRLRRVCRPLYVLIAFGLFVLWQLLFNASYTNPPPFTIPEAENVYIAANIIDGALIEGAWGRSVMRLVDMVGRERVHVSIYGGPKESLEKLGAMLGCAHTLVDETAEPLDLAAIPRTVLPTGESRIKRIAYLAAVRNRALRPLEELEMRFQKVLFINDVFFDANDAARLLWGTNVKGGMARYKAACGADFVSWWKFYDTFATRDAEGYSIGVPIYPWFAGEGEGRSRRDVLEGGDVRVRSCWGGMTAFQGGYFQEQDGKRVREEGREGKGDIEVPTLPLRFRSEPEPFWDSSE
ncbi:glycosyltransferase family 69 protein, partial [Amylocarpus encephaloides]